MHTAFTEAIPILEEIERAGYQAYFVGGAVRDVILGREITDVDIATSARPEELKKIFNHTVDVGIEHGTIVVLYRGSGYEITTFRSETGYSDNRRPDNVEFIRSLEEDLKRRDFTMNAIAMDKQGKLIDPFRGQADIREGKIVTVGPPSERFGEDALRMLRAVRFAAQLGFTIEEKTREAVKSLSKSLSKIAIERKTAEFEKILEAPYREDAFVLLSETEIYRYLPGLEASLLALEKLTHKTNTALDANEMWVLLLYHMDLRGKQAETFLRGWKLSVKKIKHILTILKWLDYGLQNEWTKWTAYQAGREPMVSAQKVVNSIKGQPDKSIRHLHILFDSLRIKERPELDLTGSDLMSWFKAEPGQWIKEMIESAEMAVASDILANDKAKIREWLTCNRN